MKKVTITQPLSKNENNWVNMPKLLNPCIDPIFKAMMTDNSPEGRKALTSFISTVIGHSISDIELLPNELPNQNDTDKQSVFDLTCVIDGKEKANIDTRQGWRACKRRQGGYAVANAGREYFQRLQQPRRISCFALDAVQRAERS